MSDYLHGAYGEWFANGNIPTAVGEGVVVAVGTAPVQNVSPKDGEGYNVNKPVLVRNIAEAKRLFGYSDDWAKYTLCEAMHHFFETKRVGPLVLINVLDPNKHRAMESKTETWDPEDGQQQLRAKASWVDIESIAAAGKTKGTDYTVEVDEIDDAVIIAETSAGSMGTGTTITYNAAKEYTAYPTPANGFARVLNAESAILDTMEVVQGRVTLVQGTDYIAAYNADKKSIDIVEKESGTFDGTQLNITYAKVDPATVAAQDVIGTTDDQGQNTGLYAVRDVYPLTGAVPAYLIAPGFSGLPAVHEVMYEVSQKVNGHWDMWMFTDLPLVDNNVPLTMQTIAAWKTTNGYNKPTETVYWPMADGVDGKKYHLSVLAAANFLELLTQYEGVPFHSASNTPATIIKKLWTGSASDNRVYDDKIINEKLNANGIASAAFVGGRWAIWGAHAADYDQDNADYVNVAETNRMMLMYVSNNFQVRRSLDVDKPLTQNDIDTIVSEEQVRLDGLKQMGALIFGEALLDAESIARSDVYSGDFVFAFRVTTTPLAKSLTAVVTWVDDGFSTYFAEA